MTNALNKTETEILNRLSNRTWIVVESFMGHGKRIQNNREVLAALSLASKGLIKATEQTSTGNAVTTLFVEKV
jgi:hypothetical protein